MTRLNKAQHAVLHALRNGAPQTTRQIGEAGDDFAILHLLDMQGMTPPLVETAGKVVVDRATLWVITPAGLATLEA